MCCLLACTYRVLPFPFAWLITGEASSPFLNIRWFLINTGRGDTFAMKATNIIFALTFFFSRILLFGYGLIDLMRNVNYLFSDPPPVPAIPAVSILVLVCGGFLLNAFWMVGIVKMAMGRQKGGKSKSAKTA
mmetsp:Transcript_8561/g.12806  ORF Transcript_8561/g.12806 Transcript_8561/m.12806 type:complete len:132 (-) Transcript_8561:175-570(-)